MQNGIEHLILLRLLRELQEVSSVALGEGIPEQIRALLPADISSVPLGGNGKPSPVVDLAIVEALEVSVAGDLVISRTSRRYPVRADRWIVATRHTQPDGTPKLVRECTRPVDYPGCVGLVVTELGVIQISSIGLVLTEVAPGVSTDDVKLKTAASLHVADNIELMQ